MAEKYWGDEGTRQNPRQLSEVEIDSASKKQIKVVIVKKTQDLRERMEEQTK